MPPNAVMPDSLKLLPQTSQVSGIQTIIRNRNTSRNEFVFYSERLMRLVFEYALSFLPHESYQVKTPQNIQYEGIRFSGVGLCGVSILRFIIIFYYLNNNNNINNKERGKRWNTR